MHISFASLAPAALSSLFLLASIGQVQAASLAKRASTCNGHSELCSKSYGNVSFVGAHNSYAVGVNNFFVNQDYDVTQQLNDGVRLLQMQAHNKSGTIQLCHSSCTFYNGGTLTDYLGKVKSWMDSNTEDVVTLLIVNIDNLPATQFASDFSSAGLDSLSYSPSSSSLSASSWPTLGSMIDSGKRLVTFLDNQANFESVPYLIDEFTNIWETAYDVTDISLFDCGVNRTKGETSSQMYLINHFLDTVIAGQPTPDVEKANTTNAASGEGSLGAEVATCVASHGNAPNFLMVDFYEFGGGSVFEVAAAQNGVTYTKPSSLATPKPTTSDSSSSSDGNGASGLWTQWIAMMGVSAGVLVGSALVL